MLFDCPSVDENEDIGSSLKLLISPHSIVLVYTSIDNSPPCMHSHFVTNM
ncbi:hypothetical protein UUU_16510 [Klebsiella pneumoniae subsp. pneumoniae DSM 30104 = JCM 1662 = NBRC 14940]|nr:hypothetical protein UUU_16510 [Klebsiella pneumoniae subsp. pneumoniae DSM 30104 = JCM 1662 = NBRC 14940]